MRNHSFSRAYISVGSVFQTKRTMSWRRSAAPEPSSPRREGRLVSPLHEDSREAILAELVHPQGRVKDREVNRPQVLLGVASLKRGRKRRFAIAQGLSEGAQPGSLPEHHAHQRDPARGQRHVLPVDGIPGGNRAKKVSCWNLFGHTDNADTTLRREDVGGSRFPRTGPSIPCREPSRRRVRRGWPDLAAATNAWLA